MTLEELKAEAKKQGYNLTKIPCYQCSCYMPYPNPYHKDKDGKWIWNKRTGEYECSECGRNPAYERTTPDCSEIDKYRYCRWCGAPMEVLNGKNDI